MEYEFWNEGDEERTIGTLLGQLDNGYWVDRQVGRRWLHCRPVGQNGKTLESMKEPISHDSE